MKNLIMFIFLMALMSCDKKDDDIIDRDFTGHYKIISMTADIPADLNRDGIKSTDIYHEIASPYHTRDGKNLSFHDFDGWQNYAEVRPLPEHTNSFQFIFFNVPHQIIRYSGEEENSPFLMMYTNQFNVHMYELTNTSEVEIIELNPEYSIQFGKIHSLHRIDHGNLSLRLTQKIFDFVDEQWLDLELTVIYTKVE